MMHHHHTILRQITVLVAFLAALYPVHSYRGASVHSDGNANAAWRVEADSSDFDAARQRRPSSRPSGSRFGDRRQALEEGIQKHRRGVEQAVNGAGSADPQRMLSPPPVELDPVQGLIADLRDDKPIVLGFDQGDRALAADLNILPQSMAPRTPGRVDEVVKIVDANAKTAVLVILPSKDPNPSSVLTRIAVEAATRANCLIFQPSSCEFDPLSQNPTLTIPDTAIPFEIPGPGKHEIELPKGLDINPAQPVIIVQSLEHDENVVAIMQKVEDVQKTILHQGPVRGARDVVADVYYSNYNIGSQTYFQHMPLIHQQQVVSSIHMSHEYLRFSGAMVRLVEDFGKEHFAVMDGENLAIRNVKLARSRQVVVTKLANYYADRFQNGNYELGHIGL